MATYNKFQDFTEQVLTGTHNFTSDTFRVALSNTAPVATNTVFANITEIAGGNGYTAGGHALDSMVLSETAGTAKVVFADEVITATGTIGPFRYIVIYNDTPTSPADPLVAWYDYGSPVTMSNGETFTIDLDVTNGLLQLV